MNQINLLVFTLVFHLPLASLAIVGGDSAKGLPSQLCQIVPLLNNQPQAEMSCSALVIGKNQLRTAGHCGFDFYNDRIEAVVVDCLKDVPRVFRKDDIAWSFGDEQGPLNPHFAVSDTARLTKDIAYIELPEDSEFSATPMPILDSDEIKDKILSNQCYLVGTGYTESMTWGVPQAKKVRAEQFVDHVNGVVELKGKPHVSGHDSGGALVCDDKYAGTIVAQLGKGSLISTKGLESKVELQSCSGETPSSAISRAFVHLMGFAEVRQYLQFQTQQGLSFCGSGITLHKNVYQYYKNLIFIKMFDASGELQKQVTVLLQASSIQGHHSTEGRPWTVLKNSDFDAQAFANLRTEFGFNGEAKAPQKALAKNKVDDLFVKQKDQMSEASILNFFSTDEKDYFLVTWLKEVTGSGANLYTSQVSPQYAIVEQAEGHVSIVKKGGAFSQFLIPAENLLEEASQGKPTSFEEKIEYIDELSEL